MAGLALSSLVWLGDPAAAEHAQPTHTLEVTATGLDTYPAYDPAVRRYAATTTSDTFTGGASVTVSASTSDPGGTVLVDGVPLVHGSATLTGVQPGDEISVVYDDAGGREADAVVVLPADFPTLTATIREPGIEPGLVALTLSQWQLGNGWPSFEVVLDANGVPTWVHSSQSGGLDLKRQPNGRYSVARSTSEPGRTGAEIVEMDEAFQPVAVHRTVGLVNTDNHDSILRADGSQVLLAYEPDSATGLTDSVIQEIDPQGEVVFQWDSRALADETVVSGKDYAHINSVEVINGGQDFLASFRNLSAVVAIAREPHDGYQPGDVVWKLGGRDSSFDLVDDPWGGPCGQHTASQLPNGDVMVFDDGSVNGFGALCVDPADPSGPVHERPRSRLAVWHLDQQAGTATLVRSYAPDGWFSWFMGSAQYLGQTGNVLLGWAAETEAVATELDADDHLVWKLVATPSSNDRTYISYRATKLEAPDAIDPEVGVAVPAEGATYDVGDQVAADFSCTDTGGSTLQTCGSSVPGTPLDTATPGEHTFSVTATDGMGNSTTVVRHYTVQIGAYRPDAEVQRADGTWSGTRVYGSSDTQATSRRVRPGRSVAVHFRVTNRGAQIDRYLVTGTAGTRLLGATYRYDGRNVTDAVVAGTWRSPRTAPGGHQVLVARVDASRQARHGATRQFDVLVRSAHEPDDVDAAALRVRVR